jgi:hypothetical protein
VEDIPEKWKKYRKNGRNTRNVQGHTQSLNILIHRNEKGYLEFTFWVKTTLGTYLP